MSAPRLGVAVMTRAPSDPAGKTRLKAERGLVTALQTAMLGDTLAALASLRAAASTVFVAPSPGAIAEMERVLPSGWKARLQQGASLGDRLLDAIGAMLRDCDRVLVTGSDAPFVAEPLRALGVIAADEVVLVPSEDGGYAAIGLGRLVPSLFVGMPWSTDRVAAETRARARSAGLVVRDLATTYDIDGPDDLARLRGDLALDRSRAPRTAGALGIGSA